jgi:hypothetical protein
MELTGNSHPMELTGNMAQCPLSYRSGKEVMSVVAKRTILLIHVSAVPEVIRHVLRTRMDLVLKQF